MIKSFVTNIFPFCQHLPPNPGTNWYPWLSKTMLTEDGKHVQ